MNSRPVVLAVLLCLLCARPGAPQSTDASLSGSVLDPAGAAVALAIVTAENINTGVATQTVSNDAGVYVFPALQPGAYRVRVEHPGFRKMIYTEVELEVGARLSMNIALELGAVTDFVEVKSEPGTQIGYLTSSVGSVVTGRKVLELPLAGRNAMDLITTQAGVFNDHFAGARTGSLNVSLDGTNIQDNLLDGLNFTMVAANISVDRVEEFRIVTSPADAELGRGSGQIQAITRSGTNSFHGSLFEEHRNTALNANTWFNNQRGISPVTGDPISPRDILIRNQYGARLGGPLRRNHTFFNFNYEGRNDRARNAVTSTVYTETARRGLFRFFPGAQNANANAIIPTVDLQGNPAQPPNATGDLQAVSVFGRDPNRMVSDASGVIAKQLSLIPLPNNFRAGDGLNTAGFTWQRSVPIDFRQFDIRLDHQFTSTHRATFSQSHQSSDSLNTTGAQRFPASPGGAAPNHTDIYSLAVTSTLRPNLLNEFRAGVFRPLQRLKAPWEVGGVDTLPTAAGYPYILSFSFVDSPLFPATTADPSNRLTPVYQYSDNMTWLKGRHAFKGGAEIRFVSSTGYDANVVMPRATIGAGGVSVQNITAIPLIGQNAGGATALLNDLSGSISSVQQAFNSPGGQNPAFVPGENKQRNWRQKELSFFFKDDIKVTSNLTLNLGLRYEWYAVPFEAQGKGLALAGGAGGIFGISGTSFADMFQPGRTNGSLTRVQPVGGGTINPNIKLYDNDNNNFAPAVGLSWALPSLGPWFGKGKTVLRAGYGIGYERNPIYLVHRISAFEPGYLTVPTLTSASLISTANLKLPLTPALKPLELVPLTDRTQDVYAYEDHLRTPYVQNFNVSIQRSIWKDMVLDVRYVGSAGSKLIRTANLSEVNIFENGILEAFRITQAGGNSPLLDRIFMGFNIPGVGVVDGVRITGSDVVRSPNAGLQGVLTSNNPGSLASFLSSTNQLTGVNGGLLRRAGLPENFVVPNPQFGAPQLAGNFAASTYHSFQAELVKRYASGWIFQGNYTWSKALGEEEGEGIFLQGNYRTLRDRSQDKKLMSYHRTHVVRTNGIWELPFGKGRRFAHQGVVARGILGHILEGWQTGAIFNVFSGAPIGFSAVNAFNTSGGPTPVAMAAVDKGLGSVERTPNGVVYFGGLGQVADPYIARITTLQGIQGRSTMRAITDAAGRLLMANPEPGQFGTLAPRMIEGPGSFRLDVNLVKKIRVSEGRELWLEADAINATNSPQFGNPDTNINSTNFGRITSAGGNRIVVVKLRFSF